MATPQNVKKYLDSKGIKYEEIAHKTVYTAYDAAQTLKKELKEVAKNLLVQADKTFVLVIVSADKKVDLKKLKKALKAKNVKIPGEEVMVKVLKIKPGAVSSFGKLHQLETVVDKALLKTKKVLLSTGSFTDSVLMKAKDFIQLEEAKLADVAMKGGYVIPKKVKKQMKKAKAAAKKKKPAKKVVKKIAKKAVKKNTKKPVRKTVKKKVGKKR